MASPEKSTPLESGPKIASKAFWSPDVAASRNAVPASAGDAKVFWVGSLADFCDLLHEVSVVISAQSAKTAQKRPIGFSRFRIMYDIRLPPGTNLVSRSEP